MSVRVSITPRELVIGVQVFTSCDQIEGEDYSKEEENRLGTGIQ